MMQILFSSAIAGICGMGLGGLISAVFLKLPSKNVICGLLSFAAGVMVSIVCFGLMPEAMDLAGTAVSLTGLFIGISVIMVLNRFVDKVSVRKNNAIQIHNTPEELYHESQFINDRARMIRSGTLMVMAISLHNVPEGIAIGAGGSHDYELGMLLALMIALHNIPEGMAIATPLLAGGINKWKVCLITALSGMTTIIGGVIGILIGSISDVSIALSLAAAGGAMLYVVFGEIIPQTIIMTKNRIAPLVTLIGMFIGLLVTQI